MLDFKPNESKICLVLFLFIWTVLAFFFTQYFGNPLFDDEIVYTNPAIAKSISTWLDHSFGHPPGWHILNYLNYSLRGQGALSVRTFVFGLSFVTWLGFYLLLSHFTRAVFALLISIFLMSYQYAFFSMILSHPVVSATLCGLLGLMFLRKDHLFLSGVFLFLALSLRESCLIFLLAAVFLRRDKKNLIHCAFQLLVFVSYYVIYYFGKGELLFNDQMKHRLIHNAPVFKFSLIQIKNYFSLIIFKQASYGCLLLIPLVILLIFYRYKNKYKIDRFSQALFLASFCHSVFFIFYAEHGTRDGFMSYACLSLAVFLSVYQLNLLKSWATMALTSLLFFPLYESSLRLSKRLDAEKRIVRLIKEAETFLISKNKFGKSLLTTNPYHHYFRSTELGYVSRPWKTQWYGGSQKAQVESGSNIVFVPTPSYRDGKVIRNLHLYARHKGLKEKHFKVKNFEEAFSLYYE